MEDPADDEFDLDWALDSILSPLALVDCDLRLVAVNDAYCAAGRRTRDQLIGLRLIDAFPENPDDPHDNGPRDLSDSLNRVMATGRAEVMPLQRYDVQEADGSFVQRYWSITTSPVRRRRSGPIDYAFIHAEEVTSFIDERLRRASAGESPTSAGQTEAVDTIFTSVLRRSEALNAFAEALVRATTVNDVATAFLGAGLDLVNGSGGTFVVRAGDRLSTLDRRSVIGTDDRWKSFPLSPGGDPFSDAITTGTPRLFANRAEFLAAYPSLNDEIARTTNGAWAVLPLSDGTRNVAAIGATFHQPHAITPLVRLDLQNVAALTAPAMSRATLLAEQADAIQSITRVLEADLDAPTGIATSILYRPAANLSNAGGDWFDIIATSRSRTVLAIGDIAAHGAATMGEMLRARAALQSHALQGDSTSQIATKVSASMSRFSDTFATSCVAIYDATDATLAWTTAGHPYPLLIDADGTAELLAETHGPPLGVSSASHAYVEGRRQLQPGWTLVLYTDGLIERRGETLDTGLERLTVAARTAPSRDRLAEHLYAELLPRDEHADDVAILVATFVPSG